MVSDGSHVENEASEIGEMLTRVDTVRTYDGAEELVIGEGAVLKMVDDPDNDDGVVDISDEDNSISLTATINTSKPNPLPKSFVVICIVLFSEAFVASMLFPFVAFMVRDFGVAKADNEVGYYSGVIASSFFLGQFASGFFWGWLSDRVGRRPVLLVGLVGSGAGVAAFGLSFSFTWAICCRVFSGLMNSNFSIARSWIGDMTDPTNRVKGFSMVGLMWGAGSIVGPALGGILSNPQENLKFLGLGDDSFFAVHPYAFPSFLGSFISLIGAITTYFLLPESLHMKKQKELELDRIIAETEATELKLQQEQQPNLTENQSLLNSDTNNTTKTTEVDFEFNESEEDLELGSTKKQQNFVQKLKSKFFKEKEAKDYVKMRKEKSMDNLAVKKKPGFSIVFKTKSVLIVTILICIQGASVVAIDDIFPLWAMTEPPAGLGFTSAQIGVAWSIGGVAMLIFQAFVYTPLIAKLSPLGGVKIGSVTFALVFLSYPLMGHLANTPWVWLGLSGSLIGRYVCGSMAGTTLNILLNTVGGPVVQRHRGVVNGFSMSLRGMAMAFSPFLASSFFAWSVGNGLGFPFNYWFEFIILAICSIAVGVGSYWIPKHET